MPTLKPFSTRSFGHPWLWLTLCGVASVAPSVQAQPEVDGEPDSSRFILIPSDTDDWTKHFRLGVLVGLGISTDFKMSGTFNPSGNKAQKGIYSDGYVLPDSQTANDGYTANWGYNDASQYDGDHTLKMHSVSQYTTAGSEHDDAGPLPGFELAYGMNYWYWRSARVGWELGFGLLPIDVSQNIPKGQNATVIQNTYTFDTGNIIVPGAPYQGNGNGSGPLISTAHSTSTDTIGNGTVSGSHELDVMLYTVRLGPSFYWDLTEKVGMSLGAGPALGIVSGSYKYDETVTVVSGSGTTFTKNKGQIDSTSVVYGGYVNGAIMYHVEDEGHSADFYIGAQYMPLGDATLSGGGREGTLKLGGQVYISAGVNWAF